MMAALNVLIQCAHPMCSPPVTAISTCGYYIHPTAFGCLGLEIQHISVYLGSWARVLSRRQADKLGYISPMVVHKASRTERSGTSENFNHSKPYNKEHGM